MKITETEFNKAAGDSIKYGVSYAGKGPIWAYYGEVLRFMLGKEINYTVFTPSDYIESLDGEKLKELGNYIYNDLSKKYHLSPGMYRISEMDFSELGKIDEPYPILWFGDDIVIFTQKHEKFNNKDAIVLRAIYYTSDSFTTAHAILSDIKEKSDELISSEDKNSDEVTIKFSLVDTDEMGVYCDNTGSLTMPRLILDQFNSDLPDDKIQKALRDKKGGIFIFHGEPGCGKTSYIKYLIQTNRDIQFSYMGVDLLLDARKLRSYVISHRLDNMVIIVEDCELILKSRGYGQGNPTLSDILNISNGLIGDMTNTKFIFTFNNSLSTIDPALLRKCRLRYRYEFKPLCGENLKNLATKLGLELKEKELASGLSLSDLFGYNTEVEVKEQNTKRIGFR